MARKGCSELCPLLTCRVREPERAGGHGPAEERATGGEVPRQGQSGGGEGEALLSLVKISPIQQSFGSPDSNLSSTSGKDEVGAAVRSCEGGISHVTVMCRVRVRLSAREFSLMWTGSRARLPGRRRRGRSVSSSRTAATPAPRR